MFALQIDNDFPYLHVEGQGCLASVLPPNTTKTNPSFFQICLKWPYCSALRATVARRGIGEQVLFILTTINNNATYEITFSRRFIS